MFCRCKYHFATSCNVFSLKCLYLLTSAAAQLTIVLFLSAHCMLKIDCISRQYRSCRCEEIRHVRLETNQSTNQQLPHFSTNRELKHKTFCSDTFAAAIKFIHRSSKLGHKDDEGRADKFKHWTFFSCCSFIQS